MDIAVRRPMSVRVVSDESIEVLETIRGAMRKRDGSVHVTQVQSSAVHEGGSAESSTSRKRTTLPCVDKKGQCDDE